MLEENILIRGSQAPNPIFPVRSNSLVLVNSIFIVNLENTAVMKINCINGKDSQLENTKKIVQNKIQ